MGDDFGDDEPPALVPLSGFERGSTVGKGRGVRTGGGRRYNAGKQVLDDGTGSATSSEGMGEQAGGLGLSGVTAASLRAELQGEMKRAGLLAATRVAQLMARRDDAIVAMRSAARADADAAVSRK